MITRTLVFQHSQKPSFSRVVLHRALGSDKGVVLGDLYHLPRALGRLLTNNVLGSFLNTDSHIVSKLLEVICKLTRLAMSLNCHRNLVPFQRFPLTIETLQWYAVFRHFIICIIWHVNLPNYFFL